MFKEPSIFNEPSVFNKSSMFKEPAFPTNQACSTNSACSTNPAYSTNPACSMNPVCCQKRTGKFCSNSFWWLSNIDLAVLFCFLKTSNQLVFPLSGKTQRCCPHKVFPRILLGLSPNAVRDATAQVPQVQRGIRCQRLPPPLSLHLDVSAFSTSLQCK